MLKSKRTRKLFTGIVAVTLVTTATIGIFNFAGTSAKMTFMKKVQDIAVTAGDIELNTTILKAGTGEPVDEAYMKDLLQNLYAGYGNSSTLDSKYAVDVLVESTGSLNADFCLYLSGNFMDSDPATPIEKRIRIRSVPVIGEEGVSLVSTLGTYGATLEQLSQAAETHNDTSTQTAKYASIAKGVLKSENATEEGKKKARVRLYFSMDDLDANVETFEGISDWSETSADNAAQNGTTNFNMTIKAIANPENQEKTSESTMVVP